MIQVSKKFPRDDVVVLQTCDGTSRYHDMLNLTSKTTRKFCELNNFHYKSFVGLKRGNLPWHATYNRILLLKELADSDFRGWCLYLDADAWISDLEFDLRGYLANKTRYSVIGASAFDLSDHYWNFNIGILFFNLRKPFTRKLVHEWNKVLCSFDLEQEAKHWGEEIPDDQAMFHDILRNHQKARSRVLHVEKTFINTPCSSFIRQALRDQFSNMNDRMSFLKRQVDNIVGAT